MGQGATAARRDGVQTNDASQRDSEPGSRHCQRATVADKTRDASLIRLGETWRVVTGHCAHWYSKRHKGYSSSHTAASVRRGNRSGVRGRGRGSLLLAFLLLLLPHRRDLFLAGGDSEHRRRWRGREDDVPLSNIGELVLERCQLLALEGDDDGQRRRRDERRDEETRTKNFCQPVGLRRLNPPGERSRGEERR